MSLDGLQQIVVGVGAFVLEAIHDEGRRAVCAALDIGLDALAVNMLIEQPRQFERLLMFKQPTVHLREVLFALPCPATSGSRAQRLQNLDELDVEIGHRTCDQWHAPGAFVTDVNRQAMVDESKST